MDVKQFLDFIRSQSPIDIAERLIMKKSIHALDSEDEYEKYRQIVRNDHPNAYHIAVVGSANWKFSLAPQKNLREFHHKSDIDIAIICADSFLHTWDALRKHHRDHYYSLTQDGRNGLKRNGENVYCGFVTPKWVPSLQSSIRQQHEKRTNAYSTKDVKFKTVNMMYFRNMDETIDYYVRGVRAAAR